MVPCLTLLTTFTASSAASGLGLFELCSTAVFRSFFYVSCLFLILFLFSYLFFYDLLLLYCYYYFLQRYLSTLVDLTHLKGSRRFVLELRGTSIMLVSY